MIKDLKLVMTFSHYGHKATMVIRNLFWCVYLGFQYEVHVVKKYVPLFIKLNQSFFFINFPRLCHRGQ